MLRNQLVVKKKVTYIDLTTFILSVNFVFYAHRIAPPSAKECNMIKFLKKVIHIYAFYYHSAS